MGYLTIFATFYRLYTAKKLSKGITKLQAEISKMVYELDSNIEGLQNKIYKSGMGNWKEDWSLLKGSRDNLFDTFAGIRFPVVNAPLIQRVESYKIIKTNTETLSNMVSLAEEKLENLEEKLKDSALENAQIVDFKKYTKEITDFAAVKHEDSILKVKMEKEKAKSYLTEVLSKINSDAPDYSPQGAILNSDKWKTRIKLSDGELTAKNGGFLYTPIKIYCGIVDKIPTREELVNAAQKANGKKRALVNCYILSELNQQAKGVIETFSQSGMSVFCYETKTGTLVYNKNNLANSYFSGYFDPKQKPKLLKEFLWDKSENGSLDAKVLDSLRIDKSNRSLPKIGVWRGSFNKYAIKEG